MLCYSFFQRPGVRHASIETLRKLEFHRELDDCHICPQGKLKHSKLSRRTSYTQQLLERFHSDIMSPFVSGYWGERYCLLFMDEMSRKAFIKTLKSRSKVAAATLELIKKKRNRTQASLMYLRDDGAKDYKTRVLQDFLRQEGGQSWGYRKILPSIKWNGWETQPHHNGQGSLHAYRCKLDSQALTLCCTLCSAHLQ